MTEEEKKEFYSFEENLPAYLATCICPVKNGYAVSFSGISIVMIFLIDQETNLLKSQEIFIFKSMNILRINNLNCSSDDEYLVLSTYHIETRYFSWYKLATRISMLMDLPQVKELIK